MCTGLMCSMRLKTRSPHLGPHLCLQISLTPRGALRTGGSGMGCCLYSQPGCSWPSPLSLPVLEHFSHGFTPGQSLLKLCAKLAHSPGSMGPDPSCPSSPLSPPCDPTAFFLFLQCRVLASATGPLHLLPPPPGMFFLQVVGHWGLSFM